MGFLGCLKVVFGNLDVWYWVGTKKNTSSHIPNQKWRGQNGGRSVFSSQPNARHPISQSQPSNNPETPFTRFPLKICKLELGYVDCKKHANSVCRQWKAAHIDFWSPNHRAMPKTKPRTIFLIAGTPPYHIMKSRFDPSLPLKIAIFHLKLNLLETGWESLQTKLTTR